MPFAAPLPHGIIQIKIPPSNQLCAIALSTLIVFCGLAVASNAQQSGTATPEQAQTQQPNAEKHAAGPEAPKPENNGHDYSQRILCHREDALHVPL